MNYDIFISYSSQDSDVAQYVCSYIEKSGKRCWIAPRDIIPGTEWAEAILAGISQCHVMVLIFSTHANISPQIKREVERAVNRSMPILPFKIDSSLPSGSLEYFIMNSHWLDASNPPIESHFQSLVQSVDLLLRPESSRGSLGVCAYGSQLSKIGSANKLDNFQRVEAIRANNIPASIGSRFHGRDQFIKDLQSSFSTQMPGEKAANNQPKVIHGLGGLGKTRLAIEFAWRHANDYSAMLFVTADTVETFREEVAELTSPQALNLTAYAVSEQKPRIDASRRWFATHLDWLLIIDNVDSEEVAAEVTKFVGGLHGGHVLITSRMSAWSGIVQAQKLDVLTCTDASDFLLLRTGDKAGRGRKTTPSDSADAAVIAEELGGHALALEQAGAYICRRRISLSDYLQIWRSSNLEIQSWCDSTMAYSQSLTRTWQVTLDQMSAEEASLLSILSWFAPDPIPVRIIRCLDLVGVEKLVDPSVEKAIKAATEEFDSSPVLIEHGKMMNALANLADFSMVEWDSTKSEVSVHRVVQEVFRGRQQSPGPTILLVGNLLARVTPKAGAEDIRTWPDWNLLQGHIAFSVGEADRRKLAGSTSILMRELGDLVNGKGLYEEAESLFRRSLAINEQNLGPDDPEITRGLVNLSSVLESLHRMGEAECLARRALSISQRLQGDVDNADLAIARALLRLGTLLYNKASYIEAEELLRQAVSIAEKAHGGKHPKFASALTSLASVLHATGKFPEAELLHTQAVEINESYYGPEHPDVAGDLGNLALLLEELGRDEEEVEQLLRRALKIDQSFFGEHHPKVAKDLNNLAFFFSNRARWEKAEKLYRQALAMEEQFFGKEHPRYGRVLNNLAVLMKDLNRTDEAERLHHQVQIIDERAYGQRHPSVAKHYSNYAMLLHATNRHAKAEPLLNQAVSIARSFFGSDNPSTATYLNNLGLLLSDTNRLHEAEQSYQEAITIVESAFGSIHPTVAKYRSNLAMLYCKTDRYGKAEPLLRQAVSTAETSFGNHHPILATYLNNLGLLLSNTHRLVEAEQVLKQALSINETVFQPNHPSTVSDLSNLALLFREKGGRGLAQLLLRRCLLIVSKSLGVDSPEFALALNNFAMLLEDLGQLDEAELIIRRSLAIIESSYGSNHPDIAQRLNNLAVIRIGQSDFLIAEQMLRRAYSIATNCYDEKHSDCSISLANLAYLFSQRGQALEAKTLLVASLKSIEESYGCESPKVAEILDPLSQLLIGTHYPVEAEALALRALVIRETSHGPCHLDVARSLSTVAGLIMISGRYEVAQWLSLRALKIARKMLGENHRETAAHMSNLGGIALAEGKAAKAVRTLHLAAIIRERALGPSHPEVANDLHVLGMALQAADRTADAESIMEYAYMLISTWETVNGEHQYIESIRDFFSGLLVLQDVSSIAINERLHKTQEVNAVAGSAEDLLASLLGPIGSIDSALQRVMADFHPLEKATNQYVDLNLLISPMLDQKPLDTPAGRNAGAVAALARGKPAMAMALLDESTFDQSEHNRDVSSYTIKLNRAISMRELGRLPQAESQFKQLMLDMNQYAEVPQYVHGRSFFHWSLCLFRLNEMDQALSAVKESLQYYEGLTFDMTFPPLWIEQSQQLLAEIESGQTPANQDSIDYDKALSKAHSRLNATRKLTILPPKDSAHSIVVQMCGPLLAVGEILSEDSNGSNNESQVPHLRPDKSVTTQLCDILGDAGSVDQILKSLDCKNEISDEHLQTILDLNSPISPTLDEIVASESEST